MNILSVFQQMLVLLIMLVVGLVCSKTGVIDPDGNKKLTRYALCVPQGCMVLSSVINVDFEISASKLISVFFAGFAMYFILILLGALVWLCLRKKPDIRGLFAFMTVFGNVGFMGFPVVSALYGSQAVLYAALFNIPFNLLAYSFGITLLRSEVQGGIEIDWHTMLNAPLVCTVIAVILLFVKIHIPLPIEKAVDYFGDSVIPLSMVIIGASLGDMPLKEALADWRCYVFSVIKLCLVPVAVHYAMSLFISDPMVLGTMTVLAGMPVAAVAVMISLRYGKKPQLASKTVFISTVLSTLSIPLICWVLL